MPANNTILTNGTNSQRWSDSAKGAAFAGLAFMAGLTAHGQHGFSDNLAVSTAGAAMMYLAGRHIEHTKKRRLHSAQKKK